MNQSLLIIGPDIRLRGVGGVTIHVQRLRDYLERIGFKYEFIDYKSCSIWKLSRDISQNKVIHVHISNPVYQFVVVFLARILGKKVVVTLHGNYGRFGKVMNTIVRASLKLATVPIVINNRSYEACKNLNEKMVLIPAFIPPQKDELLPKEVVAVLSSFHNAGKTVYSTNASNITIDTVGNEIYGIGFLVQYFKDTDDKALVISDPSGNYEKKYHGLHSSNVYFINYPHSYYEILKLSDYSIRNTSTDGDALSVRESLYLGVPALCSDAVDRPAGVRLFKYCDKESFERSMKENSDGVIDVENGVESLILIYKALSQ